MPRSPISRLARPEPIADKHQRNAGDDDRLRPVGRVAQRYPQQIAKCTDGEQVKCQPRNERRAGRHAVDCWLCQCEDDRSGCEDDDL